MSMARMRRNRIDPITHLDIGRWAVVALTLASLAICGVEAGGPLNAITTLAYLTVTGFALLDGTGALPSYLGTRPFIWILIIPASIAINVVAGTALAAFGPGLSSCWLWAIAAAVVAAGMTASAMRRRSS